MRGSSTEDIFSDDELLRKTNLEKPAVLRMFDTLQKEGVLARDLKRPHCMEELENYIRERNH